MTMDNPTRATDAVIAVIDKAVEHGRRQRAKAQRMKAKARANAAAYEIAIVSFIDVLGFRAMLGARSPHEIHDIMLSLREFSMPEEEPARRMKDVRLSSRAFAESVSDAVVRVRVFDTQYSDGAFFHELVDLLHVQIQCINHGVLIRAGLAIGSIHVGLNGSGPVFGLRWFCYRKVSEVYRILYLQPDLDVTVILWKRQWRGALMTISRYIIERASFYGVEEPTATTPRDVDSKKHTMKERAFLGYIGRRDQPGYDVAPRVRTH